MDGDELGAVGKRRLDLDLRNHLGNAVHTSARVSSVAPWLISSATAAPVARAFHDGRAQVRDRFRIVELESPCEPPLRDQRRR